jgi:LuxR family maltose regulon positive regulatory protein
MSVLGSLALVEAWCGRTERADALALEALAIARSVGMLSHPSTADAYLSIALTALERGEPRHAALPLHEATVRAAANRRTQSMWIANVALALRQASEGLVAEATSTVQAAQVSLGTPPPPVGADRLTALRCRLLRLGGEPELASSMAEAVSSPMPCLAFEQVAAALTLGRPDVARKVMGDAPPPDAALEPLAAVQHQILLSWLCDVEGSADESRAHLVDALGVGGLHSLVDVFVRAGPAVVQRISALDDGHGPLRADILRRAREVNTPIPGTELVDPLTDRELEILSYLPSRYTNAELAERCYVSVNTIKTHMAHIYRKLDVPNRNAAIVKARDLGLI